MRKCGDIDGTNANAQTCESVGVHETSDVESTVLKNSDDSSFFKIKEAQSVDGDTYSCTCFELCNYKPVAPEHVGLRFYHTYTTWTAVGSITGSTTLDNGDGLNPTTLIRRKKAGTASGSTLDGDTLPQRTILLGEPITISVKVKNVVLHM